MTPHGLRPHTHGEREQIALHLLDGWRRAFGGRLVAAATTASFARGADRPYSDLELVVFLQTPPAPGEAAYFQRIVGGLLVEAEYVTEAEYLDRYRALSREWYLAGAAPLQPLYNAPVVERVREARDAITYPPEAYLLRAAERFLDVQESFGKVLSAVSAGDRAAIPLLVSDAVTQALVTLAFLNRRPFTTLATFVAEGRGLAAQPPSFGAFLDLLETGRFGDLRQIERVAVQVFAEFESMFEDRGYALYDTSLDPSLPNKSYTVEP